MTEEELFELNYKFLIQSIRNLRPGAEYTLRGTSYEGLEWLDKTQTKPTKEEINSKIEELRNAEPMNRLKEHRNKLLQNCDWTQSADSPLSDSAKAEWATYRQTLRDLPSTANPTLDGTFIKDVDWPQEPS